MTLGRYAAIFVPGDPPRTATVAFWAPGGAPLPSPTGELDLAVRVDGEVLLQRVPVERVPVADALPILARVRRGGDAHPAAAFWGAAALLGLQ
ncbi:MAG: SNF2-related protein, partial [Cryptosporangiaceae bacterium]|nr:SNF2-related protein [Cryptosporangiaceae bacterium]